MLFFFLLFSESQILTSGYSVGDGPIFLDQLRCLGSEQSLLQCQLGRAIGLHHCNHSMDVGIYCSGTCIMHTKGKVAIKMCLGSASFKSLYSVLHHQHSVQVLSETTSTTYILL